MSNELTTTSNGGIALSSQEKLEAIELFTAMLNAPVPQEEIFKASDGKSDEIPISYIESKLDEIYSRQWGYKQCDYCVVVNELCCDVMIYVIDPQTQREIVRAGTAAVQIMMDSVPDRLKFMPADTPERILEEEAKTKERNAWALDLQNKKPFALSLQRPATKSRSLKNACKSLGITFGRNLNRKQTDSPEAYYTHLFHAEDSLYQAKQQLAAAETDDDFTMIWETFEDLQQNTEFQKEFQYRKRLASKKK